MRVLSLMLAVGLGACALPDGKVSQSKRTDNKAVTKDVDAAADGGADASQAELTPSKNDAAMPDPEPKADAGTRSTTGAGGMRAPSNEDAGKAAAGGTPAKPTPKAKGELCRGDEDCAAGNCKTGDNGERRCYGKLKVDQTCVEAYDCDGFSCVPLTFKGKAGVCVDKAACPAQGTCFEDYGIALCQLDQHCSDQSGSFNDCYRHACTLAGTTNAQCLAALPAEQSLNESACCPPGGAQKGSCGTAPQCGCGDTKKCDIDAETGRPTCQTEGSAPPGGSCVKPEDCQKGYGCIGSICKQYCEGPMDGSCAAGGVCKQILFKTGPTASYFCSRPCDPLSPTSTEQPFIGCAEGQRCNPSPDGHADCAVSGTIPAGSSCDDGAGRPVFNGCAPDSFCAKQQTLVCAPLCRVGKDDCKDGTCGAFPDDHYYVMQTEVGLCAPP